MSALNAQEYEKAKELFAKCSGYKDALIMDKVICVHDHAISLFEEQDGAALADVLYSFAEPFIQDEEWKVDAALFSTTQGCPFVAADGKEIGKHFFSDTYDVWMYYDRPPEIRYGGYEFNYVVEQEERKITRLLCLIVDIEHPDTEVRYAVRFCMDTGKLLYWSFFTSEPFATIKESQP